MEAFIERQSHASLLQVCLNGLVLVPYFSALYVWFEMSAKMSEHRLARGKHNLFFESAAEHSLQNCTLSTCILPIH